MEKGVKHDFRCRINLRLSKLYENKDLVNIWVESNKIVETGSSSKTELSFHHNEGFFVAL